MKVGETRTSRGVACYVPHPKNNVSFSHSGDASLRRRRAFIFRPRNSASATPSTWLLAGSSPPSALTVQATSFRATCFLELPPIGWQLFILGNSKSDSTAFPLFLDTYATRLLAEPLSQHRPKLHEGARIHNHTLI